MAGLEAVVTREGFRPPRIWSWDEEVPVPARKPTLVDGERLTRAEFERRYEALPHVKKAELIEGVVHMPSPVHHLGHGVPHSQIVGWLMIYSAATPGVELSDNGTVRLGRDSVVQPDALLRLDESLGGQSRLTPDDYIEGPPELIAEIAASSTSYDLHAKFDLYRRGGVREYLVWQVYDRRIDWFALRDGEYIPLQPDDEGVVSSRVFPGLRLAVDALLSGDLAAVLDGLRRGLRSPEHAAFVTRLMQSGSETQ